MQPIFVTAPRESALLFVIERTGRIRVIENGVLRPQPLLDIRDMVDLAGERGLLGLAFSPDYAATGRFYIAYSEPETFHRYRHRAVARQSSDERGRSPLHAGALAHPADREPARSQGRVDRLPSRRPGDLYIAIGDGGDHNDPDDEAQNLRDRRGKILAHGRTPEAGPGFQGSPRSNPYF